MVPEKLKEVKKKLENGERVEPISVRDFLYWFWSPCWRTRAACGFDTDAS
ncbi:hypothetical protein EV200_101487 [Pedobacter psychrotolerans]|uniref:Uncharacterized protein n=1 Tax=Pedobacter psychrotolerans TaxID=1843235 RepID=A0A4R2HQH0_9SPHI|nr:hypothetical protein EV200_101487 [Pedobacter psychrotolerans]GGE42606.1 hypothetical protein GCM10011413_05720 [Pedobacter psychrotolerans]